MSDGAFYIALKFKAGELDTTDGRSGYRYKPGARMYPTRQPASGMRRRWLGEGYDSRIAKFWIDDKGNPQVEFCDQDDNIKPVCGVTKSSKKRWATSATEHPYWVSHRCVLDVGHRGWHSTTRKVTRHSEFQSDGIPE